MANIIEMQSQDRCAWDEKRVCGYDVDLIDGPTAPLIHRAARVWLIRHGRGVLRLQDREYPLRPGSVVSILPWQISEIAKVEETLDCHLIIYHFESINHIIKYLYNVGNEELPLMRELENSPVVYCSGEQVSQLSVIFSQIREEMEKEPFGGPDEPYVINKLVELVLWIHRIGRQNGQEGYGSPRQDIQSSELLPYIYGHLSEKITLKSLSGRFYMSEAAISQYITSTTGLSFFDLLNEMRAGKMLNYLLYTDLTLEELAEILGFVDSAHISRVFADRTGMKANEYRKTYQRVNEICKIKENPAACRIAAYLYRNFDKELTAKAVADEFCMSVQDMNRTLLYQVEKNFSDFVSFIRVNRACELLLATGLTVTQIAVEVGFGSAKSLNRNFLKFRLMTPGQFRSRVESKDGLDGIEPEQKGKNTIKIQRKP